MPVAAAIAVVGVATTATSQKQARKSQRAQEKAQNLSFLDSSQGFTQAIGKQNLISSRASAKASRIKAYGSLAQIAVILGDDAGLFDKKDS